MKAKTGVALFLCCVILSLSLMAGAVNSGDVKIFLEDSEYIFSPSPLLREGQVMVPMRSFFELMGITVAWYDESRIALAYRETIDVHLPDNGDPPEINGEMTSFDTPACIIDGDIYVPLRLAAESIGFEVEWDEERFAAILHEGDLHGTGFLGVDEENARREEDEALLYLEGTGTFMWPLQGGQVTSPYGWRRGRFHAGIDIGAPVGTPILAADSGVVVFEGWNGAYGRSIVVKSGRYYTRYAHNSANLVSRGDYVNQGQVIGLVGATGRASGPHLHFEIRTGGIYGKTLNPASHLIR